MMYEDGFNIEEWKAKKLAERQETFAAQEESLKDVFSKEEQKSDLKDSVYNNTIVKKEEDKNE